LTPETLRAEVGTVARLGLHWRHPRAWRQLRRIELRAYRGEARVGAVSVHPRSRRLRDAGQRLRVEIEAVDVRGARQRERKAGAIRVVG
jgi:hypothetical protein